MSTPVKLFLKTLLSFHLKEFFSFVFFRFLSSLHRRPRLVRNLSVGFSPTQPSLRSKLRPRLLLRSSSHEEAGRPIKWTVIYCTPWTITGCPACEPNSTDCEYSRPLRHIQYNRTPSLRAIATL